MITLTQARYAHSFAITSYTAAITKKPNKGETINEGSKAQDGITETVKRDLLVVGCRKKVLVYGAGRSGLKDAWVFTSSL